MASRAFLELVASAVNVDVTSYPNDSKLEQKLLYELKTLTAQSGTATTLAAPADEYQVSGDANI